jgi:pro-apoptotic serine protease NMA111
MAMLYLHPSENYALLQYNPALVQASVKSAQISVKNMEQGQKTILVGLTDDESQVVFAKTTVTKIAIKTIQGDTSRLHYCAAPLDWIQIDTALGNKCSGGVLLSEDGMVSALWLNHLNKEYRGGFVMSSLPSIVKEIQQGRIPEPRTLGVEWSALSIHEGRDRNVPEERIQKMVDSNPSRHQLFMVRKLYYPLSSSIMLKDIILTVQGRQITTISDLHMMYHHPVLDMEIVRDGQEMIIKVDTMSTRDLETDRVITFCGANFHKPHYAVRQQSVDLPSEIWVDYVVWYSHCILRFLWLTSFSLAAHLLGLILILRCYGCKQY